MICITDWGPQYPGDGELTNNVFKCDYCKDEFEVPCYPDGNLVYSDVPFLSTTEQYVEKRDTFYFCCGSCKDDFKEFCVEYDGYEIFEES